MSGARSVALVGPGAIGTTVAAALQQVGRAPVLCGRTARDRLDLDGAGERITVPGPVRTDPGTVGPVDLVLVAVKATQVEAAAPWLRALCRPDTVVCALQNGVEQVAQLGPHTAGGPVVPTVVWFPAVPAPDGAVLLRGPAKVLVPDVDAARVVVEAFAGTFCTVETVADFTTAAWRKLLQNAGAGLLALTGRRSGVFARDDIGDLTLAYLRECVAVGRAAGADLGDEVPGEVLAAFRGYPPDLTTSILTDREAGRPLEWDIRNGVIGRLGRRHGIATPVSDVLVPLLAATSDGPG